MIVCANNIIQTGSIGYRACSHRFSQVVQICVYIVNASSIYVGFICIIMPENWNSGILVHRLTFYRMEWIWISISTHAHITTNMPDKNRLTIDKMNKL